MKPFGPFTLALAATAGFVFCSAHYVSAQTAAKAPVAKPAAASAAPPSVMGTTVNAKNSQWLGNTLRLDGDVRIVAPGQLDLAADAAGADVVDKTFSQIRAIGNVKLKVDVPARKGGTPFHVESSSDNATLDPKTSTLVLSGKVSGWLQPKDGQRTVLGGDIVTVKFDKANTSIEATGGATPVALTVAVPNEGAFAGIGTVTVTGKQLLANQNGDSTVTGGARAFSSGDRKFDVMANDFIITRGADGVLETLKTTGRTTLISDLPAPTPAAIPATIPAGALVAKPAATPTTNSVGTPVRLEVTADSGLVKRADSSLTFDGHVKGVYFLQNAAGVRTSYPFSGEHAVFKLIPATATTKADFSLEFSGAPTTVQAPRFDFGM